MGLMSIWLFIFLSGMTSYGADNTYVETDGYAESCAYWGYECFKDYYQARQKAQKKANIQCYNLGFDKAENKAQNNMNCNSGIRVDNEEYAQSISYTYCSDRFLCEYESLKSEDSSTLKVCNCGCQGKPNCR